TGCRCGRRDRPRRCPGQTGGPSGRRTRLQLAARRFRPPDRPSAPPPSLPRPAEVEPHEQHVRRPAVGKRAERLAAPRVRGCALGVVRGAASRLVLSATGGGGAGATVLFGDFALGAGAGFSSAGRSTASGALRASSVGAGAATRWTRYVGGAGLRALAAPTRNSTPTKAWTKTVPARPMPTLAGARGRRVTAPP